jgi:hypothetical protein
MDEPGAKRLKQYQTDNRQHQFAQNSNWSYLETATLQPPVQPYDDFGAIQPLPTPNRWLFGDAAVPESSNRSHPENTPLQPSLQPYDVFDPLPSFPTPHEMLIEDGDRPKGSDIVTSNCFICFGMVSFLTALHGYHT